MRTLIIILQILIFSFWSSVSQDRPILKSYTIDDGLPHFWVRDAVQDDRGFMWFGTQEGLTRFDGYSFKVYPYDQQDTAAIDSDRIHTMDIDDKGRLWISRFFWPLQCWDPKTENWQSYTSDEYNLSSTDVFFDPPHYIWLGADDDAIISKLNINTGQVVNFRVESETMPDKTVWDIQRDLKGDLWIATNNGLYLFDSAATKFTRYTYQHLYPQAQRVYFENITPIGLSELLVETAAGPLLFDTSLKKFKPILNYQDDTYLGLGSFAIKQGTDIWIGNSPSLSESKSTHQGILKYNPKSGSVTSYGMDITVPLYKDRSDNIWVVDPKNGINSFKPEQRKFLNYQLSFLDVEKDRVTAMIQDRDGFHWVGTNNGLYKLNIKKDLKSGMIPMKAPLFSIPVTSLYQDLNQVIWIGTIRGIYQYLPQEERIRKYPLELNNLPGMPGDFQNQILDIYRDQEGTMWFAGKGLLALDPINDRLEFHEVPYHDNSHSNYLSDMHEDSFGTLWFSWIPKSLLAFDKETEQFHCFEVPYTNLIREIFFDGNRSLWIGSATGLSRLILKPLDSLVTDGPVFTNHNHQILRDYVSEIQSFGNDLWVRYSKGLTRINILTNDVYHFDQHDGLLHPNYFGWSTSFKTTDELWFFWEDSFEVFHPDSISYNTYIPPVVLSDFQISNQTMNIGDSLNGKPLLTRAIYDTESITLPPGLTFSLEFAALDYTDPKENLYSYKLEGLDDQWSLPGHQRIATYTNLWEGEYVFKVKGSNNDGVWNEKGTSIIITILPPWYRSKLAYGIYGGLLILILVLSHRFIAKKEREKAQTQLKDLQLEKAKELDHAKTRFFANISHEFRTPLTLIMGPVKQMYEGTFTGDTKTVFGVIIRNAHRLLQLVNQLLDFTKLEAGASTLQATSGDMAEFLRTMFATFESTARQRKIRYMFQSSVSHLQAYFDRVQLEKVIINLLSNAFKFTQSGDSINLKLIKEDNGSPVNKGEGIAEIIVEDSGKGIPADKLPHIFDRFYQADDSYTRAQEGTGLGLTLAKELVELHHGTISVTSAKGAGTTFVIQLPLGRKHLSDDEITEEKVAGTSDPTMSAILSGSTLPLQIDNGKEDLPLILMVEDNHDMRLYIKDMLMGSYNLMEASNGTAGLNQALEHTPDLVISDVMMPDMDGHQLCQKLKTDERTSHIPVILLTARAGEEAKLEGLETGADAYMTKPFSSAELKARIQNLIEVRESLRKKFGRNLSVGWQDLQVSSIDQRFLERAFDIIEINRSNAKFNSELFAKEVGMSRSQLHRKLKALTNYSTGEFIRTYRLNYARELLSKNFGDIAEISYESGFSSPSYFTECFKKHFGVVPSQFGKPDQDGYIQT